MLRSIALILALAHPLAGQVDTGTLDSKVIGEYLGLARAYARLSVQSTEQSVEAIDREKDLVDTSPRSVRIMEGIADYPELLDLVTDECSAGKIRLQLAIRAIVLAMQSERTAWITGMQSADRLIDFQSEIIEVLAGFRLPIEFGRKMQLPDPPYVPPPPRRQAAR